jgi:hypothetical protein
LLLLRMIVVAIMTVLVHCALPSVDHAPCTSSVVVVVGGGDVWW